MSQKLQLLAMLESSHTGYGLRINWSGGAIKGESVMVEAERPFESEWYITEFEFDREGRLVEVHTYPGEGG